PVARRQQHGSQMAALDAEDREVDVVLDAQAEEEPGLLIGAGQAELRSLAGRQGGDVLAKQLDGARGRREVARDDVEERRLPGPVRAENRATLAGEELEVDVADGMQAAEAPAEPPEAEDR